MLVKDMSRQSLHGHDSIWKMVLTSHAMQRDDTSCMQVLQSKLDKLKESRAGTHLGTEQQELETLRMMVRCSLCNVRTKRSVITRCMHMFCEECLAQWQAKRHRNCPSCKTGFSAQDVKQIYLV